MKQIIQALKGTRDFYPEQMARRTWLYDRIRAASKLFGFEEYEGPFLEKVELYAAKSGEELVSQQAFAFSDRGGELISLRPELTPTLARMIAQKQNDLLFPLRWWSFGPFWRYERPQRGRSREFFQWNADLMGCDSPEADAELIMLAIRFFLDCGLDSLMVRIFFNDRSLMDSELERIGIEKTRRLEVLKLIDRHKKSAPEKWTADALESGLSQVQLKALNDLLANKNTWTQSERLEKVVGVIRENGFMEFLEYDPDVVRGLDYYTGIVFEAYEVAASGRAILGGGRYDNLVGDVGGNPLPGVGFAMGDVVISNILEEKNLYEEYSRRNTILVTVFDESQAASAQNLASELRTKGIDTAIYPETAKLDKQIRYADRAGMRFVLIQGPDEVAAGMIAVKDLNEKSQTLVEKKKITEVLRSLLDKAQGV